ncbi:MAG TPA: molybdenum cofactor guanylyltransferase MobA [Rhodocyclaceae bacterium]|nr:molybdenum cofactor guanylyltransferase MobA [Rhodocyclaceae bacterium]
MDVALITGLILAGGQGRRMGGCDKGLVHLDGKPLIAHILGRFAPQVGPLLINANRNADAYAAFGHPVIADRLAGHAGPLAGLDAGLAACETPFLACTPCDSPCLPEDLVARLADALESRGADAAVARAGGRLHPVFALIRCTTAEALTAYIDGGGRRVETWFNGLHTVTCAFDDCPAAFDNLNTLEDLRTHTHTPV